jgi:hypothetical protein
MKFCVLCVELIVPEFPKQIVNLLAENKDSAVLKRFLSDKESNKEFSERGIIKLHSILGIKN